MTRGIRPEPAGIAPDRRSDAKRSQRFRIRIRDWLVAVALVALLTAGVAQLIRVRSLRAERQWAEAIRMKEEALMRQRETIRRMTIQLRDLENRSGEGFRGIGVLPESHDGVFPDPDRKGLPSDGRTDL